MAITIGKLELARLKKFVTSDEYDVVMVILAKYIQELQAEPVTGESAFEELRGLHKQQGGVDALKDFFNRIEKAEFETHGIR